MVATGEGGWEGGWAESVKTEFAVNVRSTLLSCDVWFGVKDSFKSAVACQLCPFPQTSEVWRNS